MRVSKRIDDAESQWNNCKFFVIHFNVGFIFTAGFSYTYSGNPIGVLVAGTYTNNCAAPAFNDGSRYLAVMPSSRTVAGNATLQSTLSLESVSFFLSSIDTFNSVSLLNAAGSVIQTFMKSSFIVPVNGDQSVPATNRRVTLTVGASEQRIADVRFSSTVNALEVDNVVSAVPEPATWAMMLLGIGMIDAAAHYRRRNYTVAYA